MGGSRARSAYLLFTPSITAPFTIGVLVGILGTAAGQPDSSAPNDLPQNAAPDASPPAQPAPTTPPPTTPPPTAPTPTTPPPTTIDAPHASDTPAPASPRAGVEIHGFVSEGGFWSTANDYIGVSSRGSLALFEAGVNVSTEVADRLRAGIQLFGRDVGAFRDIPPRIDWAYLDYRWKPWLGLRAGIIKMPFGLSNEYADIDSARTSILLPQSVYPLRDRSALLAQTGFAAYGEQRLGSGAGTLEYQVWLGTLDIPENALVLSSNARLDGIDTRYVTGAQLFWRTPVEGLRLGGTFLRTSIDFNITLDAATVAALIMAKLVPADYNGKLVISQRPDMLWVASAEYTRDDWTFAAEYARTYKHQQSTLPDLLPAFDEHTERFYALASRRFSRALEVGAYYSVLFADVDDRGGHNEMKFAERFYAWQRDAAATLRYDVNDHWLWKLEAHVIDGTADLFTTMDIKPDRFWGLFLVKTTVTF